MEMFNGTCGFDSGNLGCYQSMDNNIVPCFGLARIKPTCPKFRLTGIGVPADRIPPLPPCPIPKFPKISIKQLIRRAKGGASPAPKHQSSSKLGKHHRRNCAPQSEMNRYNFEKLCGKKVGRQDCRSSKTNTLPDYVAGPPPHRSWTKKGEMPYCWTINGSNSRKREHPCSSTKVNNKRLHREEENVSASNTLSESNADSLLKVVQKSVDSTMQSYYLHTMEKIEGLSTRLLENECMLCKMYMGIIERLSKQNKISDKQFKELYDALMQKYQDGLARKKGTVHSSKCDDVKGTIDYEGSESAFDEEDETTSGYRHRRKARYNENMFALDKGAERDLHSRRIVENRIRNPHHLYSTSSNIEKAHTSSSISTPLHSADAARSNTESSLATETRSSRSTSQSFNTNCHSHHRQRIPCSQVKTGMSPIPEASAELSGHSKKSRDNMEKHQTNRVVRSKESELNLVESFLNDRGNCDQWNTEEFREVIRKLYVMTHGCECKCQCQNISYVDSSSQTDFMSMPENTRSAHKNSSEDYVDTTSQSINPASSRHCSSSSKYERQSPSSRPDICRSRCNQSNEEYCRESRKDKNYGSRQDGSKTHKVCSDRERRASKSSDHSSPKRDCPSPKDLQFNPCEGNKSRRMSTESDSCSPQRDKKPSFWKRCACSKRTKSPSDTSPAPKKSKIKSKAARNDSSPKRRHGAQKSSDSSPHKKKRSSTLCRSPCSKKARQKRAASSSPQKITKPSGGSFQRSRSFNEQLCRGRTDLHPKPANSANLTRAKSPSKPLTSMEGNKTTSNISSRKWNPAEMCNSSKLLRESASSRSSSPRVSAKYSRTSPQRSSIEAVKIEDLGADESSNAVNSKVRSRSFTGYNHAIECEKFLEKCCQRNEFTNSSQEKYNIGDKSREKEKVKSSTSVKRKGSMSPCKNSSVYSSHNSNHSSPTRCSASGISKSSSPSPSRYRGATSSGSFKHQVSSQQNTKTLNSSEGVSTRSSLHDEGNQSKGKVSAPVMKRETKSNFSEGGEDFKSPKGSAIPDTKSETRIPTPNISKNRNVEARRASYNECLNRVNETKKKTAENLSEPAQKNDVNAVRSKPRSSPSYPGSRRTSLSPTEGRKNQSPCAKTGKMSELEKLRIIISSPNYQMEECNNKHLSYNSMVASAKLTSNKSFCRGSAPAEECCKSSENSKSPSPDRKSRNTRSCSKNAEDNTRHLDDENFKDKNMRKETSGADDMQKPNNRPYRSRSYPSRRCSTSSPETAKRDDDKKPEVSPRLSRTLENQSNSSKLKTIEDDRVSEVFGDDSVPKKYSEETLIDDGRRDHDDNRKDLDQSRQSFASADYEEEKFYRKEKVMDASGMDIVRMEESRESTGKNKKRGSSSGNQLRSTSMPMEPQIQESPSLITAESDCQTLDDSYQNLLYSEEPSTSRNSKPSSPRYSQTTTPSEPKPQPDKEPGFGSQDFPAESFPFPMNNEQTADLTDSVYANDYGNQVNALHNDPMNKTIRRLAVESESHYATQRNMSYQSNCIAEDQSTVSNSAESQLYECSSHSMASAVTMESSCSTTFPLLRSPSREHHRTYKSSSKMKRSPTPLPTDRRCHFDDDTDEGDNSELECCPTQYSPLQLLPNLRPRRSPSIFSSECAIPGEAEQYYNAFATCCQENNPPSFYTFDDYSCTHSHPQHRILVETPGLQAGLFDRMCSENSRGFKNRSGATSTHQSNFCPESKHSGRRQNAFPNAGGDVRSGTKRDRNKSEICEDDDYESALEDDN